MGLDTVEFVMRAEKEFGLKLLDEEVSLISTVGEFADLIHQKLLVKHGLKHCPSNEAVFEIIKKLLFEEQKIFGDRISRNSRFVDDLHMD